MRVVKFVFCGILGDVLFSMGRCQGVEKLLVRWGEAVIDFVAGCPECIFGQGLGQARHMYNSNSGLRR